MMLELNARREELYWAKHRWFRYKDRDTLAEIELLGRDIKVLTDAIIDGNQTRSCKWGKLCDI